MIFGVVARARRALYAGGILARERLPRPVVSLGNLVLGGAGKTPHTIHLARWLSGRGLRVAVLSRGYGRRSRGVAWASDGEGAIAPARECGDEPALIARSLPGVPVVVGESRAEAGRACLARRPVDVFLLDDGFQHLSLHRDADLLLVDCARGLSNRMTVPLGPLREPPSHARFADGLVVTKCPDTAEGERAARAVPIPPGRPRAFSRFVPAGILGIGDATGGIPSSGSEVLAFSGIARNDSFRDTLAGAGYRVARFLPFPDHHEYSPADIARIAGESAGLPVVTTEKDLVRISGGASFPLYALRVEVEYLSGWEELSQMILDRIEGRGAR